MLIDILGSHVVAKWATNTPVIDVRHAEKHDMDLFAGSKQAVQSMLSEVSYEKVPQVSSKSFSVEHVDLISITYRELSVRTTYRMRRTNLVCFGRMPVMHGGCFRRSCPWSNSKQPRA